MQTILTDLSIEQLETIIARAVRTELQILNISKECERKALLTNNTKIDPIQTGDIVSVPYIANILSVSHCTVYKLIRQGILTGASSSRPMLFSKIQILECIEKNKELIDRRISYGKQIRDIISCGVAIKETAKIKDVKINRGFNLENNPDITDCDGAAAILKISTSGVRKRALHNAIPHYMSKHRYYFSIHELQEWMARHPTNKRIFLSRNNNPIDKNNIESKIKQTLENMTHEQFMQIKMRQATNNIKLNLD
jgi:hypothetical protein